MIGPLKVRSTLGIIGFQVSAAGLGRFMHIILRAVVTVIDMCLTVPRLAALAYPYEIANQNRVLFQSFR